MVDLPAYERDPRLTRVETSILETGRSDDRHVAVLADTVLYPEGGGQPADRGTISGVEVVDVQKVDGVIRHVLAGPIEGPSVEVVLDWARRFDHMQQHTAQHLLTAIAADRFGWQTTAFHLGERVSDIELDVQTLDPAEIAELEEAVAREVRAARPVRARRVSRDTYEELEVRSRGLPAGHIGDVRLVEIEGIDLNTCGGTHCEHTAELEAIKLLGTESLRGGTRLFYVAGERLRRRLGVEVGRTAELRALLGAADDELVGAVELRLEQLKDGVRRLRRLEEQLAESIVEGLAARAESLSVLHFDGRGLPFLQRVARDLLDRDPARTVLLTSGEEDGVFLLGAGEDADVDVAEYGGRIAMLLEGKGGGRGSVFQGRASRVSRRDQAVAVLSAATG